MSTAKQVWDALQKKYDTEEARSKKYAVSRYQMTDDRLVEAQSHEIQKIAQEIISEEHSEGQNQGVLVGKSVTRLRIEKEARRHDQKEEVNAIPRKQSTAVLKLDLKPKGNKMKRKSNK
ncbi:uncharacterized protein E5676_scaffold95G00320 [Cucumis melo var. makuwa]|uniref:Uncharacterized protein n=1 Tax=Cucumis melo var. makuwa TaxID=1194695 RepID=A0A5D3DTM5_CUCMM|nr:uncharacterized protein E6C27_scaffold67G001040 [Cucumis melo var. makuwa]TYK27046.1 uncharacterized protein E5676_scaffold95G00320 [Cucumis melo var. makuwa]